MELLSYIVDMVSDCFKICPNNRYSSYREIVSYDIDNKILLRVITFLIEVDIVFESGDFNDILDSIFDLKI